MARPKPIPIRCTAVRQVAPRVTRADFVGYVFAGDPDPAAYVELWFEEPPDPWPPRRGGRRSAKRTFTPIHLDVGSGSFSVEFVLHGDGVATDWVASSQPGDTIWAGPIKGGFTLDESSSHLMIVGDDTAIPAAATIVDRHGAHIPMTVVLEVIDADDERGVGSEVAVDPIWLHRGKDPQRAGQATLNLLESMDIPTGTQWWIAGERDAIRDMRDVITERFATDKAAISLNAHWRLNPVDPRSRIP